MPVRKPQRDESSLDLFKCLWSDPIQSLKDFVDGVEPCFKNDHLQSKLRQCVVLLDRLLPGRVEATVVQPKWRVSAGESRLMNAPFYHLLIFAVEYEQTILFRDFQLLRRSWKVLHGYFAWLLCPCACPSACTIPAAQVGASGRVAALPRPVLPPNSRRLLVKANATRPRNPSAGTSDLYAPQGARQTFGRQTWRFTSSAAQHQH